MNYEGEIETLFSKWKERHIADDDFAMNMPNLYIKEAFVRDGVPFPDNYFELPFEKKILFVLKESNYPDVLGDYSQVDRYCDFANTGVDNWRGKIREKFATIYNATMVPGEKLKLTEAIKYVAFININKRGGGASSNKKTLGQYATKYKDLIKEQIELINPMYIVCCGTYNFMLNNVYEGVAPTNSVTLIKMYHPSYWVKSFQEFVDDCRISIESAT